MAMCHNLRERKSKFWITSGKKANEKETSGKEKVGEDFPLESSWNKSSGEREEKGGKEKKRKKMKRKRREDE